MSRLVVVLAAVLCLAAMVVSANADTVAVRFFSGNGLIVVQREVPPGMEPAEAAIRALVAGPTETEKALGYTTRIPAGTTVGRISIVADTAEIDLSQAVLVGLNEAALADIGDQFGSSLGDFPSILSIKLTCGGKLLSSYLPSAPQVGTPAPALVKTNGVGLAGKKICIGPSHGRYWVGSWEWQRELFCGLGENVLEDTNSIRLVQFLKQYLEQDGAIFTTPRQLDESDCCNTDTGMPWWKMCASTWLHHAGLPGEIWASYSGNYGADTATNRSSDDVRARPLYADLQGADIYIAHHTNGALGTGTETFRDTQMEHPGHIINSTALANAVQNSIITNVRNSFPEEPNWANRGVKDGAGRYGEIRIPDRPAILIELAFHDRCDKDAIYLTDDFFRSLCEWSIYKGICDYFGNTPTWDKYSCEYVSDTIPTFMTAGRAYPVTVTYRNRGVSWFDTRGFHLGAVGDTDPFSDVTRFDVAGEVKPGDTFTFNFILVAPSYSGHFTTDWRMIREGYQWFGPTVSKYVTVRTLVDVQPPTDPQNLHIAGRTSSSLSLAWDASDDDFGVVGYRIYRDGVQVGTSATTTYTDTGLADNTTYTYRVDAYDAIPNYSDVSAPASGTTIAIAFQDGFVDASNWTLDSTVSGNVAPVLSTDMTHGVISGDGSLFFQAGAPHLVYHDLAPSLTTGGYKTGTLGGWIYDVSGAVGGLRTALQANLYDASGTCQAIYWIGATNDNPPDLSTHYIGAVYSSAWTYFDLGERSTDWHKLAIEVLPYTGSNDLNFYLDGALAYTASQPSAAANACIRRIYLGYNSDVNQVQDAYFDDISFETVPPAAPTSLAGASLSPTSIRWNFTDNANNEVGSRLYDGTTQLLQSDVINATYIDETGLIPNTSYTRTVTAYAGRYESAGATGTASTLPVAPTLSNVTCDKAAGVWQHTNLFTFTAVGGFGPGTVDHYRTVWDQQPLHTWTGTETVWSAGDSVKTAGASALGWYYHLKGYNLANQENGTLDLGPFYFDGAAPVINSVTVTPTLAAVGDTLHAVVSATDDAAVTSVTANSVPLDKVGGSWVGDILAVEPIGVNSVTVEARDAAEHSTVNSSATYRSAKILAMSTSAAWLPVVNSFYGTNLFKFWGRVTEINDEHFSLDDGSGVPVTVYAPGYKAKVLTGDIATVRGILSISGFESTVDFIKKFEQN